MSGIARFPGRDCYSSVSVVARFPATNLITKSQELDNAAWSTQEISVTANTQVAPNGFVTAETLTGNATVNPGHEVFQAENGSANTNYTLSIFAKEGAHPYIYVKFQGNAVSEYATAVFDLTNGVVGETAQSGGTVVSASIVSAGGGWYRCILTAKCPNATNFFTTGFAQLASGNTFQTTGEIYYDATGDTLHVWGAQMELGSSVSPYVPT